MSVWMVFVHGSHGAHAQFPFLALVRYDLVRVPVRARARARGHAVVHGLDHVLCHVHGFHAAQFK